MAQRLTRTPALLALLLAALAPAPAGAGGLPPEIQAQAADLPPAAQEKLREFLDGVQCPCGCNKGSLANCILKDKSCGVSRRFARQAIAELRTGGRIVAARKGVDAYARQRAQQRRRPRLDPNKQYPIAVGDAPVQGPEAAPVTVVAYLDDQCPFCRRAWPTLKKLRQQFPDKVRLVVKQHPLPFHKQARPAARAALAAGEQGKYWEYQDRLFAPGQRLDRESLIQIARDLGLDVDRFTRDMDSGRFDQRIDQESAEAVAMGATGTPTTFINGKPLVGAQPYAYFEYQVRLALGEHPKPPPPRQRRRGPRIDPNKRYDLPVGQAPADGPADAPVTVITYQDAQCPFCRRVYPTLKKLRERFPDKVRIVLKQHPLPFHKFARVASRAELAAQAQGKYWEYKDRLMAPGQKLDRASLIQLAREVGLDVDRFTRDIDSDRFDKRIDQEAAEAMKIGATGTPASFVNGRYLRGAQPLENFVKAVEAALREAKGKPGER
ncbi:MAG: thioredoxin [Nitrospirae bacterium]|nr:MAG: thioredoxin [Nitrospirota bacterium]